MMNARLRRRAERLVAESHRLLNAIDPALVYLDESLSGWPTSPGAGHVGPCHCGHTLPCPTHPPTVDSATEAAAMRPDRARTNLDQLNKAIGAALVAATKAAHLASYWATPGIDKTTVAHRIAADDKIWCDNCERYNVRNVRRDGGGTHCDWCTNFQREWHRLPNGDILDLRARRGKVYRQDIIRIHARTDAARKAAIRKVLAN